jgi:Domain of unknown function (DUF2017)
VAKRFKSVRDGWSVKLEDWERRLLFSLPDQLLEMLGSDDPSLARLFPPAYNLDEKHEEEYQRLMRADLLERHLEAATVLKETANATRLTGEQMNGWMRALNDLRLVLGTQLDINEELDTDDIPDEGPDAMRYQVYFYLSGLLGELVQAVSGNK